jgi:hypothetical protein
MNDHKIRLRENSMSPKRERGRSRLGFDLAFVLRITAQLGFSGRSRSFDYENKTTSLRRNATTKLLIVQLDKVVITPRR